MKRLAPSRIDVNCNHLHTHIYLPRWQFDDDGDDAEMGSADNGGDMTTLVVAEVEIVKRLVWLFNLRAGGRFNSVAEEHAKSGNITGGCNCSVRGDKPSILGVGDGVIAKGPCKDWLKSVEASCGVADAEDDCDDSAKVTGEDTESDIIGGMERMVGVADVDACNGGLVAAILGAVFV